MSVVDTCSTRHLATIALRRADGGVGGAWRVVGPQLEAMVQIAITDGHDGHNAVVGVCNAEVAGRVNVLRREVLVYEACEGGVACAGLAVRVSRQVEALCRELSGVDSRQTAAETAQRQIR